MVTDRRCLLDEPPLGGASKRFAKNRAEVVDALDAESRPHPDGDLRVDRVRGDLGYREVAEGGEQATVESLPLLFGGRGAVRNGDVVAHPPLCEVFVVRRVSEGEFVFFLLGIRMVSQSLLEFESTLKRLNRRLATDSSTVRAKVNPPVVVAVFALDDGHMAPTFSSRRDSSKPFIRDLWCISNRLV